MKRSRRLAIVFCYILVFWLALPLLLWKIGRGLDRLLVLNDDARPAGWAVAGAGLLLMLGAMATLWKKGGGLPISMLPPTRLTLSGPYRYVRHPIYLGFNIVVAGMGLALASPALTWIVAPLFAPAWIAYAAIESRWLRRRFGDEYRYYSQHVGLLPRLLLDALAHALAMVFPVTVSGKGNIPKNGAAILVANHASYLDPLYIARSTWRRIYFPTTVEVFRRRLPGTLLRRLHAFPVRRYRSDPAYCRQLLFHLRTGALVGIFCECERSPWGEFQGSQTDVAAILSRLPFPVIPVGLSGNYDSGPRWADTIRRRPVRVRIGPPLAWGEAPPAMVIDRAIAALLQDDPQLLSLRGLPRLRLERVLWRCPRCLSESGWRPADLTCDRCGEVYRETADGRFCGTDGRPDTLAGLGRRLRAAVEPGPLSAAVHAWQEEDVHGQIAPLQDLGSGTLFIDRAGIHFGALTIALAAIARITTERADTLQVTAGASMWQFRLQQGSVFRLSRALNEWRGSNAARDVP